MFELFDQVSVGTVFLLCFSLFLILLFEFINGFHDTANAVATVIYTQAMRPGHAVVLSGVFNFLGVLSGGLAVAYAIVNLLPIDLLTSGDSTHLIAMIFAIVISAIIWNLGTWWLGLPASSSHTLIGAILGVGLTHALITHISVIHGVNWSKAADVGMSLLFSPFFGFVLAFVLLTGLNKFLPEFNIHQTPYLRNDVRGKKHPPFWTRFLLILSAAGVSFAHGSNDGQKGVGLVMLALLCILPHQFLIDVNANKYEIERSYYAAQQIKNYVQINQNTIMTQFPREVASESKEFCQVADVEVYANGLQQIIDARPNLADMDNAERWQMRRHSLCLANAVKQIADAPQTSSEQNAYLLQLRQDLIKPVEYAPLWVIVAIASALGFGTMIGWKRVVKTVGEGISRSHMSYAQGVCAQMTAAISIAAANMFGLPVSTTQILSSAVVGTAVANKSGVNTVTIRHIILAWLFTFPIAMILAGVLYFVMTLFI